MRIVTLIENLAYKQGLCAEHGLAIYIETENSKILFDTGQSDLFVKNAEKMGIDIANIDTLVISHGHYDHTGGLSKFIEINNKAKIFAKKGVFAPKYHGRERFVGSLIYEAALLGRLVFVDTIHEIAPDIFIMPDVTIENAIDTHFENLYTKIGDNLVPDIFSDELFVAIKRDGLINILTACSHRGITNIISTATAYFGLPVGLIMGGFHTRNCTDEQFCTIIDCLKQIQPKSIGACHCTGVEKYAEMLTELGQNVFYNHTGTEIFI